MDEKRDQQIQETLPLLKPSSSDNDVTATAETAMKTKVAEVEVHLYRLGQGPIAVFKSRLGGWDQDQLEVRDILDQYGFKSIYAFDPNGPGRTNHIRFHPGNGRSILTYKDGSVIHIDGHPKDSLIKPVTRIIIGVAVMTVMIAVVASEAPEWAAKFGFKVARIPPWFITCAIIVFTRFRRRTEDLCKKWGNNAFWYCKDLFQHSYIK